MTADVIDALAGIEPGSHLDGLRAQRPAARENAQRSFEALFEPDEPGDLPREDRFAVAVFVALLHRNTEIAAFYAQGLDAASGGPALRGQIEAEGVRGAVAEGPYGRFPAGPLSAEDREGLAFRVSEETRQTVGARLAAALAHAHMLVFHPRDADPAALQALLDVGWSVTGIVTLSQLVAFLSFQIRVVAGLRALAATPAA